jgi:hypothetical protein
LPKYPTKDPHYRILAHQRSRFTHYYFYIRDEALGPIRIISDSPVELVGPGVNNGLSIEEVQAMPKYSLY